MYQCPTFFLLSLARLFSRLLDMAGFLLADRELHERNHGKDYTHYLMTFPLKLSMLSAPWRLE